MGSNPTGGTMKLTKKQIQRWRLREEIKLELLKTISKFKSKEEPKLKITDHDFNIAMSELVSLRLR